MVKDPALRMEVTSSEFHYYISGKIDEAENYVELIDLLYGGRPQDTVYIHLNTPGGYLDSAIQIINAINATKSQVITVADGSVASAGTLILFSGDGIIVNPFSYAMIHDGSEGVLGKVSENIKQAEFSSKFIRELFHSIYQPFLSEEEVDSVLDGKDMWINSEDLKNRVVSVSKQQQEEEVNE